MRIDVITIFPELFDVPLRTSIIGRAAEAGIVDYGIHDLREHGLGRHRSVDDEPYGGGAGMVMRPEPLFAAIEPLRAAGAEVVLLDPAGERLTDALARDLARSKHLALVCGRYEGIDDRVRTVVDREVSIGDYVLTGGELPALVLIDAVVRLLPGHDPGGVPSRRLVRGRPSGAPAVHPPGAIRRSRRPPGPAGRQPRRGGPMAPARGAAPDPRSAAGPPRHGPADRRGSGDPRRAPLRRGLGRLAPIPGPLLYSGASRPRRAVAFVCHTDEPRDQARENEVVPMNAIKELEREQLRTDVPEIAPGDTVRVSVKVVEGTRERIQVFEGTVMRMRGGGLNKAITVRRIASGVGVERTFMVHAPRIDKIEVVRHGVARRAQLYFLRDRVGKSATLRERRAN